MNNKPKTTTATLPPCPSIHLPSIQERAMLVRVALGTWSARRKDKAQSAKIATDTGAAQRMVSAHKRLIEGESFTAIQRIDNQIRSIGYRFTLPWGTNGYSIISARAIADFNREIAQAFSARESAVQTFLGDYSALIVRAGHDLLGTCFDPSDYPDPAILRAKYFAKVSMIPIPCGSDFRIAVSDDILAQVRADTDSFVAESLRVAESKLVSRILEPLSAMAATLADPDKRFTGTLASNLTDILDSVSTLNVTESPTITALADSLRATLGNVDLDSCRESTHYRSQVASAAATLAEYAATLENDPTSPTSPPDLSAYAAILGGAN